MYPTKGASGLPARPDSLGMVRRAGDNLSDARVVLSEIVDGGSFTRSIPRISVAVSPVGRRVWQRATVTVPREAPGSEFAR